jgi:stage V sporulation protein AD
METNRKIIDTAGAVIVSCASAVGGKEFEGPLGACFDFHDPTDSFGQNTFEKSEAEMQRLALATAISRIGAKASNIDSLFAGDLLNQCVSSAYGLLEYDIPYFGLYGACSTAAEGLMLASVFASKGIAAMAAAVTSSHNAAAERQYRNPLEYGGQRTPTAQWTVTGAGCVLLERETDKPSVSIEKVTPGAVVDMSVSDLANMGAAMAPAAALTLKRYFDDTVTSPADYDLIVTGDLGLVGSDLLRELLFRDNISLGSNYNDCGAMIYDTAVQDVHSGGSGCGCSASVLCGYILPEMLKKTYRNVLFVTTGALMSPTSSLQGESIPGIAHLVNLKVQAE